MSTLTESDDSSESEALSAKPFGSANRARLLDAYFDAAGNPTTVSAWIHIYRLLMWIDPTTGLAHCYESDKSQPGRPWYGRSLAFHAWLADRFEVSPSELALSVDWLFKRAIEDVVALFEARKNRLAEKTKQQRKTYDALGLPQAGEDPEMALMIRHHLQDYLTGEPSGNAWKALTERLRAHLRNENKRKNLVGEGFEDAVAAIIRRIPTSKTLSVRTRQLIQDIPDFGNPGQTEKEHRVDLVVIDHDTKKRTLVSAKWSVRADREEQLASDFVTYAKLNKGAPFEYVFLTNDFDAARLVAACDRIYANNPVFGSVVHINPEGLLAAYGTSGRGAVSSLPEKLEQRRLVSLSSWLEQLLY